MMLDREKVIKGLECCTKKVCIYKDTEKECPYLELCGEYEDAFEDCTSALAKDALALLKAQEPIDAIPMDWMDAQIRGYASALKSTELKALVLVKQMWEKAQEAR